MNNKVVKRYPLSKQVADKLENMISTGEYKVGEKINTEIELMEIFQVSRNTLREAIQSLTSAGILEVKQGDGTYVKANNRFDANMHREYSQVSINDIKETINALELTIVQLAAKRRTDDDMKLISEKFFNRKNLSESIKENTLADIEFHTAIAKACHNKILIDLYNSIISYVEDQILESQIETSLKPEEIDTLHEYLYAAIKNKNPNAAQKYSRFILNI